MNFGEMKVERRSKWYRSHTLTVTIFEKLSNILDPMLGRTLAAKRCTPCRLYSTVEANPIDLSKAFNEGFSAPKPRKQPLPDTHIDHAPATRTIFVRTSQGIPSMSHAFAIIRALEEQYGTFQEFRLIRVSCLSLHERKYTYFKSLVRTMIILQDTRAIS